MRRRELPGGIPPPTKTELKRQALAVQALADRLVAAPGDLVAGLGLPDKLADAVALARRITSRAALVRQRLYVAKLLRDVDCGPIRAALDAEIQKVRTQAARFRRAERWRDRLLAEGESAFAQFILEFPAAGDTSLGALLPTARNARNPSAATAAAREIFREIRAVIENTGRGR